MVLRKCNAVDVRRLVSGRGLAERRSVPVWLVAGLALAILGGIVAAQGWRVETLDAAGDVDAWVDLVLDGEGWPHLCAQNRFHGEMQYRWRDGFGWHYDIVEQQDAPFGGRIALDPLGQPYVFYSDPSTGLLTLAHRLGTGPGWVLEHPMDWESQAVPGPVEMLAWGVAVNPTTGVPQVCYTWRQLEAPANVRLAWAERVDDGQGHSWTVRVISDRLTDGLEGVGASLVLPPDGLPRVSFFDEGAQDLYYWSAGPPGHPDQLTLLASAGTVGRYNALAVDAIGFARLVCSDETNEVVRYLFGQPETIAPTGPYTQPRFTDIALDTLGRPHVTFYDERTSDLLYARRDGAGHWHTVTVDHVGPFPSYQALSLDPLNVPCLAWYAFGDLKYAEGVPALDGDLDGDGRATIRDLMILEGGAAGRFIPGQPPCAYPLAGDFNGSRWPDGADRPGTAALLADN